MKDIGGRIGGEERAQDDERADVAGPRRGTAR
jgi:hypothetical protein